ncbi:MULTISPECIES: DUF3658 domain-containing protein [Dysosmobacter]|jgi:hypothetical protein|uniref:DUF3658 domain-containing protein n=1 Tax=Dysosmobacter sp. TaxID=2591382 RepID=UPI0023F53142|nr:MULTISPECIES: DUF3658 domain-containing protein [Dysosmobacter]MDR3949389.1 DUF3658 domain-containing protein [Dysosmobacter sp.]
MLELCFDMSTRGALRVAQRCGRSGRKGLGFVLSRTEDGGNVTSTTVIGFDDGKAPAGEEIHQIQRAQRRQAALEREAIPLGGSPSDVLVLSLGLDMGDIREPLGADRWDLLRRWCDGDDETTDRDWQRNLEAAERLRSCGSRDAVRIWVDHTPYGACGLLHAASLLKDTKADVRVVFLPPWRERPDGVVETYLGWGEVEPELFGRFLSREEPLPPVMLGAMAHRWEVLRQENAPLRAVVNGRVRSVGEDFYDEMIRRHLPEGQTKIANIIGEVLGREKPGIGDVWLAERIRQMLSTGELRMLREDRERFYRSVVERT